MEALTDRGPASGRFRETLRLHDSKKAPQILGRRLRPPPAPLEPLLYCLEMPSRRSLSVLLLVLVCAAWSAAAPRQEDLADSRRFSERIDVRLLPLVVRVVDSAGKPIPGLQPRHFRVQVGGRRVSVDSVDWISQQGSGAQASARSPTSGPLPTDHSGKLVVLFYQTSLERTRLKGQVLLRPRVKALIDSLDPQDWASVVAFDTHLRLLQDFCRDPETLSRVTSRAAVRLQEEAPGRVSGPSLARHLDLAAARQAATPEQALEVVGRALQHFPGEKVLVFLGWGLGQYGSEGVRLADDYGSALKALLDARVTVFALDITEAGYHSLEYGLRQLARSTGGSYEKPFPLSGFAVERLANTISGYYTVYVVVKDLPSGRHRVKIELNGVRGAVLSRSRFVG